MTGTGKGMSACLQGNHDSAGRSPSSSAEASRDGDAAAGVAQAPAALIHLPLPPSANNIFVNGKKGRYRSRNYEAWIIQAGYEVIRQRPEKFIGDVCVQIRFGPRNRNADCDNRIKPVLDLLKKMNVIVDDRFVVKVSAEWADVNGCEVMVGAA